MTLTKAESAGSPTTGSALKESAGNPTGPIAMINALRETDLNDHIDLLIEAFRSCRSHTVDLANPLSAEDMGIQSMPDASPTKWHLAHTTWFFETFILKPNQAGFAWFDEAFCELFNSYYNGVGKQFPRPRRGMISRPSLAQVLEYRASTDERVEQLIKSFNAGSAPRALLSLLRLGINHEQQHQELLITDIKHALSQNPGWPAYSGTTSKGFNPVTRPDSKPGKAGQADWVELAAGDVETGFAGKGFCFDNEMPRHRTLIPHCRIARCTVSNADWLAFMQDDGYQNPLLWLSEGWAWRAEHDVQAPLYWRNNGAGWQQFTLAGEQPVNPALSVAHISYYEADAFARWSGCRLPTEAEWECFARQTGLFDSADQPEDGGSCANRPVPGEYARVWEWTASAYLPYPGFNPAPGVVGEYNGKFMINQMVLRGASGATPAGHERLSYRNFFPAHARWQYSGLRLAKDGVAD